MCWYSMRMLRLLWYPCDTITCFIRNKEKSCGNRSLIYCYKYLTVLINCYAKCFNLHLVLIVYILYKYTDIFRLVSFRSLEQKRKIKIIVQFIYLICDHFHLNWIAERVLSCAQTIALQIMCCIICSWVMMKINWKTKSSRECVQVDCN